MPAIPLPSRPKPSPTTKPPPTKAQQELQARDKEPCTALPRDSPWQKTNNDKYAWDSYENVKLRTDAAIRLDNPELVMMLAMSRDDSVAGTRHYLTKIMCGFIMQDDLDEEEEREREREREKRTTGKEPVRG
jgi:hypothetical protein